MTKPIDPRVVALNARMFSHRLKLREVLVRSNVPRSTWWRWVRGADPRRVTLEKIDGAISTLISEKEVSHG